MSPAFISLHAAPLHRLGGRHRTLISSAATPRARSRPACARPQPMLPRQPARMSLLPFIPNWLILAAWAFGAYRFYRGFNRTSYQSSFRIPLALAWPLLFAVNPSYRKNFTRSIKGGDDF